MAYSHLDSSGQQTQALPRKGEDQDQHILREFKRKLTEDEGYINYFSERAKGADILQDDAPHPRARVTSSARRAWFEVRDYTQREIETREAFTNALQKDVLNPLVALRDTQTRIQNRIREDLKSATGAYEEYAHSKVPKMQRSYRAKTQAVEDFRKQQHAIEMQAKLLAEQVPKDLPETKPHPYSSHGHSPSTSSVNNATGSWGSGLSDAGAGTPPGNAQSPQTSQHPQHLPHPQQAYPQPPYQQQQQQQQSAISAPSDARSFERSHDQRTLGHGLSNSISGRARSGSGSYAATMQAVDAKSKEVFSDLAAHSKKGFAAIMQRLGGEREGEGAPSIVTPESTLGSATSSVRRGSVRHNNGAVKSAKIKRDAEEADKAYRHGVFHVETLRLRREKLQQSAITSLSQFNDELNATLLITLRAYAHVSHGTAVTLGQSTDVVFRSLRGVDANRDKALFHSRLPVVSRYPQIMYENFYVGTCKSLIFGFRLTDYDFARGETGSHGRPPLIVEKCIAWVDAMGNDAEGIYRMSGRQQTVRRLIQDIERNEETFYFTQEDDVYSVAVVLKAYLRDLPDPLFPLPHAERVKWSESRESHFNNMFSMLRGRLRRLPTIHQTTFQAVIEHLNRISNNSAENKMNAANLAVVFNSVLFGQEQMPNDDALKMHLQKDTVLEDIITHPELLFPPEGFYGNDPQSPSKANSNMSSQTRLDLYPAPTGHMPHSPMSAMSGPPTVHTPPLHVYATQHPIAAQHARAGSSDDPGLTPRTPQVPISFQPPSHTSTGQHISPQPPLPPSLPAGAQMPHMPPHPEGGLGQQLASLDLNSMGLEQALNGQGITPDEELDLLFDPAKIPTSLRESLPGEYHVRPLASDDFLRAHFALLCVLSPSPALAPSVYTALFRALKTCHDTYYIVVLVERATDQVVASGTVIKERKFIRGGGIAAHIEDIVVGPTAQGRGLGQRLVVGLRDLATELGCYKTILDCQEAKVPFYEKCGFTLRGRQMAYYVPTAEAPPRRESLAKPSPGLASSHPATPTRLAPPREDSDDDTASIAETYMTGTTGTDETFTNVSYRFPTTPRGGTLGPGVASTAPEMGLSPSVGGPGDQPVDLTTPTGSVGSAGSARVQERGSYF
ncbi:RhoGAP-domain-containing protein [Cutaneotrichosporon oleaginosum]|uniref:glucosamine-phosphate N-acetyltransferase n=1 Tax=Cutaneotrichosporon oleaginosum TaxID=879819 RepID=A0A0J0XIS5_9TREE|nr:RhoGAP-domain-containing protein [Cutaneotrichosporon oleaginosum]KLT40968.1 RhoGAP-domain-containing protein [Cutaneotrichosporon oleaginosum]